MQARHARNRGFTALELIVAMTIVAVLVATGVPTLKSYSANLRMKTAMDSLKMDLVLARRHAVSHNTQTIMCPALTADVCSTEPIWQHGWIVFTDLNGDRDKQAGEPLLKSAGAIELLVISSPASRSNVRFFPNGSAAGSNGTILFCDQRGATYAGKIIVSNTGRIRAELGGSNQKTSCL